MAFQQKLLEKSIFIVKRTGRAIVRPASSDFWKARSDSGLQSLAGCRISFEPTDSGVPQAKLFPDFRIRVTLHGASYRSKL